MGSRLAFFGVIWAYCALVWLYALNTPPWEVPDEPAHFNYVRLIVEQAALPVLQAGDYDQAYLESIKARKFPAEMSIAAIRYESHQPPLYYLLAAPFYGFDRAAALTTQLLGLRLYSALWGVVLLALIYRIAALLLPRGGGLPLLATALAAFIPQHLAMLSGVNNDVLAEVALAAVVLALLRMVADPGHSTARARKDWWYAGLLFGAALLTKTTAYVSAGLIVVAFFLLWRRGRALRAELRQAAPGLAVGLLLGAAWFARDALVYGPTDWLGLARHNAVVVGQPHTLDLYPNYLAAAADYVPIMFHSFWGQFGWMGVPLDARSYMILFAFTIFALIGLLPFLAELRHAATKTPPAPSAGASTTAAYSYQADGLLLAGAWLFFTSGATVAYSLDFFQAQGRYLFPALGAIAVFLAAGLGQWIRIAAAGAARMRMPALWVRRVLLSALIGGLILFDLYCLFRVLVPGL